MDARAVSELPIKLGDVLQVGLVVPDFQESMAAYWSLLGIGPWKIYTYAPPALCETTGRGMATEYSMRIAHAQAGPSIYKEHLAAKGEGLHHIQSRVESGIADVLAAFASRGIGVLMGGKFGEGEFYCLDTEPTLGVIYEIFQRKSRPAPEAVYPSER